MSQGTINCEINSQFIFVFIKKAKNMNVNEIIKEN